MSLRQQLNPQSVDAAKWALRRDRDQRGYDDRSPVRDDERLDVEAAVTAYLAAEQGEVPCP